MSPEAAERAAPAAGAQGMKGPAVRLRRVRKRFGFRDVLRGIDLDLERGACLAVFGPNGAGKSTLIRILATQWTPSEGSVEVLGHDLAAERESARRLVGAVLHQSFLRSELTLEENLRFYADLYGVPPSPDVGALLERFGLARFHRESVATFSQGMTKRANLIRSLLHDPELWLLDEPFSGLDPEGRGLLADAVRERVASGRTVVVVTHQTEIGRLLATRALTLADGAVVRDEAIERAGGERGGDSSGTQGA
jgi:ABC-type multidrug transport system ATPase subunit